MLESGGQVRVRSGSPSDAEALAAIFRESWELAYRGIIPHLHLQSLIKKRGCGWWKRSLRKGEGTLIAEIDGNIAGYATYGPSRSRRRHQGEIFELYLAPDYQGMGLGEYLFEASRYKLDHSQFDGLLVWALQENTQACDFYWRRGGRPFAQAIQSFGGTELEKIAFGWR